MLGSFFSILFHKVKTEVYKFKEVAFFGETDIKTVFTERGMLNSWDSQLAMTMKLAKEQAKDIFQRLQTA